jgi:general secretion pathway protein G
MRVRIRSRNCGWRLRIEVRGDNMADGGLEKTSDANPKSEIRNPKSTKRSGFTLIELMLVLVILATLSAIVVPKLTGQSKRAKVIAARTQISDLEVALDAFEIDVGRYPTTVEGLRALVERPTAEADGWQQPYLKRDVPLDPWGNEYVYRCPGQYNQDGYDVYSYGPDGKLGGDDDITNWSDEVRR